jgi:hypothetical protein
VTLLLLLVCYKPIKVSIVETPNEIDNSALIQKNGFAKEMVCIYRKAICLIENVLMKRIFILCNSKDTLRETE